MHAVSDPDGDNVRCRWASQRKDDCDNVCGALPSPIELHQVI